MQQIQSHALHNKTSRLVRFVTVLKANCTTSYNKTNRLVRFVTVLKANCVRSYNKVNRLVRLNYHCPESKLYEILQ